MFFNTSFQGWKQIEREWNQEIMSKVIKKRKMIAINSGKLPIHDKILHKDLNHTKPKGFKGVYLVATIQIIDKIHSFLSFKKSVDHGLKGFFVPEYIFSFHGQPSDLCNEFLRDLQAFVANANILVLPPFVEELSNLRVEAMKTLQIGCNPTYSQNPSNFIFPTNVITQNGFHLISLISYGRAHIEKLVECLAHNWPLNDSITNKALITTIQNKHIYKL